eukprot:5920285-Pyramimonas_sp.AAC.1
MCHQVHISSCVYYMYMDDCGHGTNLKETIEDNPGFEVEPEAPRLIARMRRGKEVSWSKPCQP